MAQVEIEDVGKCYRGPGGAEAWALRHASLTLAPGELLVLVGPSGAGKTTLLRLLAGLETVTEGRIRIDGRLANDLEPKDRDMALVFQNHALYPHLTVHENLALGLWLRKVPGAELERRIRETAAMLGLECCLERLPHTLSGGERQRAALGRALVRRPEVLLLDEPLSNLDAPRRRQIREELLHLHQRLGATMLCAMHDQADALALGSRVAVLEAGELQQVGTPRELYLRPANLFVAGFLGTPPMNLLAGHLLRRGNDLWFQSRVGEGQSEAGLSFRLADPQAERLGGLARRPVVCGLRPEHLTCVADTANGPGLGRGTIERIEPGGADSFLHLRIQGQGPRPVLARVSPGGAWRLGESIALNLDASQAHFFDAGTGRNALAS